MAQFLRNAWYAVGWSGDLSDGLLPCRVIDQPLVVFRDLEGRAQAIIDRCPHRFAPLSLGVHKGDRIACKYHGLEFDGNGRCVHSPFSATIPEAAHLHSYPVAEVNHILWVWMGDPSAADLNLVPRFDALDHPAAKTVSGVTQITAPYEMAADNLMDLTHISFLHGQVFGPTDLTRAVRTVTHEGDAVIMDWDMPATTPAPSFEPIFENGDRAVDIWAVLRWRPAANISLEVGNTPLGRPRAEGRTFTLINLLTPESATQTRYLWAATRSHSTVNEDIANSVLLGILKYAFDQDDGPMIEACFDRMNGNTDLLSLRPVLLPTDAGAVQCRRALAGMIAREQGHNAAVKKTLVNA